MSQFMSTSPRGCVHCFCDSRTRISLHHGGRGPLIRSAPHPVPSTLFEQCGLRAASRLTGKKNKRRIESNENRYPCNLYPYSIFYYVVSNGRFRPPRSPLQCHAESTSRRQ